MCRRAVCPDRPYGPSLSHQGSVPGAGRGPQFVLCLAHPAAKFTGRRECSAAGKNHTPLYSQSSSLWQPPFVCLFAPGRHRLQPQPGGPAHAGFAVKSPAETGVPAQDHGRQTRPTAWSGPARPIRSGSVTSLTWPRPKVGCIWRPDCCITQIGGCSTPVAAFGPCCAPAASNPA